MPTYEYRCEQCSHQFEVFASMSDPAPEACESCGDGPLVKVLFPVAVHYKGSGFYSTDYKGSRAGSGSAGADSGSSSNGDAGGSDSSSAPAGGSESSSTSAGAGTSSGSSGSSSSDA